MKKLSEKTKREYIKIGYEDQLEEILYSKAYKVIFINGKFGIGKTSFLNNVLQSMEFKEERKKNFKKNKYKKEFKIYEEFVEANYIDYMYNSLKEEENVIEKFITGNVIDILYVIIAVVIICLQIYVKKSTEIPMEIFSTMIISASILLFIKTKVERNKVNKIKYIKKKVSLYKYIIIDDLDRVYIENKEILKMIHFLQELDSEFKIILLGDRNIFISSDNNLDMLEKYYDYVFEITKEIVAKKYYEELKKILNEKFTIKEGLEGEIDSSSLSFILEIISGYEARTIKKMTDYLNSLDEEMIKRIEKLYFYDYIMVVIIYYTDYKNYEKLFEILYQYSVEISDVFSVIGSGEENIKNEAKKKITDLNLSKRIKNNIHKIFDNKNNSTYFTRIIDNPLEYKINSVESENFSDKEFKEIFTDWLNEKPENITRENINRYANLTKDDKELKTMILKRCQVDDKYSIYIFKEFNIMLRNKYGVIEDSDYEDNNLKFLGIIWNSDKQGDKIIYEKIKEVDFSSLNKYNKSYYLIREKYCNEEEQLQFLLDNDKDLFNDVLKIMKDVSGFIIWWLENKIIDILDENNIVLFQEVLEAEKKILDDGFLISDKEEINKREDRYKKFKEKVENGNVNMNSIK